MRTTEIRTRLHEYINMAEDKKIKAIYTMFEHEIDRELVWWEDIDLLNKLEKDYDAYKNNKTKGYTLHEVDLALTKLKEQNPNAK